MADFARSAHPGVQAQLDRLAAFSPGGDRLGLDRIRALLDRLGRPQDRLPPVFHVAGTNGKGSVCAFLRAALEASGRKVHVFTSPHLVRFNERIRVAGELIFDDDLAALLTEVLDASTGIEPSFFEATTAAALLQFARVPADACILEVGLGGRLDATNIVDLPLVCGIASLGLDHQQFLGRRILGIAAEKAAIAKAGVPLVTQRYPPAVAASIARVARERGASWLPCGVAWDAKPRGGKLHYADARGDLALPLPDLPGPHQALNAALAVAMLRHQQVLTVEAPAFATAMSLAEWPARLQRLAAGPLAGTRETWLDGGHNSSAARQVALFARRRFDEGRPLHLIFASLASKAPAAMLGPFRGIADHVHAVPIADHDCFDPAELVAIAERLGLPASAHCTVAGALRAVPSHGRVLIFGSLYLAGEVLAANGEEPV